jgi:hypothetical protein
LQGQRKRDATNDGKIGRTNNWGRKGKEVVGQMPSSTINNKSNCLFNSVVCLFYFTFTYYSDSDWSPKKP